MKKATKKKVEPKAVRPGSSSINKGRAGSTSLIADVRSLVRSARQAAATAVNTLQVRTNFEIGRRIVEHEQQGAKLASYGTDLLNVLSTELTQEFGSGFSVTNLRLMRQFFIEYSGRIGQTAPDQSVPRLSIHQTAPGELANTAEQVSALSQRAVQGQRGTQDGEDEPARQPLRQKPKNENRNGNDLRRPEGPKHTSPGQRPGFVNHVAVQALKGRNIRRMPDRFALSGLADCGGNPNPGRCPGLICRAPLGRKASAQNQRVNQLPGGRP